MQCSYAISRRRFLGMTTALSAGTILAARELLGMHAPGAGWDPDRPLFTLRRPLRLQPVLMYRVAVPRPETSWKSWGGVQTDAAAAEEAARIGDELKLLAERAEFPVDVAPVVLVRSADEARALAETACDARVVYPASGGGEVLRACLTGAPNVLVFMRRRSGPVYYWYEALSSRYLATADGPTSPGAAPAADAPLAHVDDVVVDDPDELLWRLRAIAAVRDLRGTRIVALGGAWGKYSADAPAVARERFGLTIDEVSYEAFGPRLEQALADPAMRRRAESWTDRYLALPGTSLATEREFVVRAFVLYALFRELMEEREATAFTIKSCMGTIIPMSKTTACLTLGLLNDEGWLAFCESDFVIIPAGILLRYVSSRPVFLHNSTFPHAGEVTCAHCTCPRRLDGRTYEPALLTTHYESEYGAAPKVDMPLGQEVTFLDPEYSVARWLGFKGVVRGNPAYEICRSQQDVEIAGDWRKLLAEARDSHWMMAYGDWLRESRYAARKLGIQWVGLA